MAEHKLSPLEKETIILFHEGDKMAECYTHNQKLIKQLTNLCEERSDEVRLKEDSGVGGLSFIFPKSWVKIRPKRIISEEERARRAETMRRTRYNRVLASESESID